MLHESFVMFHEWVAHPEYPEYPGPRHSWPEGASNTAKS